MKVRLAFAVWLILGLYATCDAKTYSSTTFGYSLYVPDGWVQIPNPFLQNSMNATSPNKFVTFELGFQRSDAVEPLDYPRLIVGVVPYSKLGLNQQPSEEQIRDLATKITGTEVSDLQHMIDSKFSAERRENVSAKGTSGGTVDWKNHRVHWFMEGEVDGEQVVGHNVLVFGNRAWLMAGFWVRKGELSDSSGMIADSIDSLRFDASTAYRSNLATSPTRNRPTLIERTAQTCIAMLIIYGIGYAVRKFRKGTADESPPTNVPNPQPVPTPQPVPSPKARVVCGQCGGRFTAPLTAIGKRTKCPKCGNALTVEASI